MNKRLRLLIGTLALLGVLPQSAQASCVPADCASMGYTKTLQQCMGESAYLACPFDTSKYFCIPSNKPEVGMIYYSDGTFSKEVEAGKTPVGIIGAVLRNRAWVIALTETKLKFGGSDRFADEVCVYDGYMNTYYLNAYADKAFTAATYCYTYAPVSSGSGSSGWYLGAQNEFMHIHSNRTKINAALSKLSKTQMSTSTDAYWTSTEYNISEAYSSKRVNDVQGELNHVSKNNILRVRCIMEI